jgi:hypothetical protein
MAIEIIEEVGGLITARVSGMVKKTEVENAQKAVIRIIRSGLKARILLIAEGFQGWDNKGDWGDVSFQMKYDDEIEKIAVVGEKKWEDLVSVFLGKGLRPMEIKLFQPSQLGIARAWIGSR